MANSIEDIKKLREETGAGPVDIKKALDQAGGDFEKAKEILRAAGAIKASKKAGKEANDGVIDFYLHPNLKTGVLLDLRCETDFVAKSPEFKNLAHEICLHIAALKTENVETLLVQPWVKDETKTIKHLVEQTTAKVGEHIEIKRFTRYEI